MFEFFKKLFGIETPKKPVRKSSSVKHTGRVAIISAEYKEDSPLRTMETVTVLPLWYMNNCSFEHVQFAYPSDDLVAPVISEDDRKALKKYVQDVCPEPDSSIAIYQKLNDPYSSVKEISALVSSDPMLAAQILKLVNSAAFGIDKEVTSVGRAVTLLGFQNVKSLVLNHSIRHGISKVESELSLRIREHSSMCSAIGYHLAQKTPGVDRFTVSTMSLLHDMGKFLLPMIGEKGKGLRLSIAVPDMIVEALVASIFADLWHLPSTIISSLEYAHHPHFYSLLDVPSDIRKQVTLLSMSNLLANAMGYPDGDQLYPIKKEFLNEIRKEDSPERWIDSAMATQIEHFRGVLK